MRYIEDLKAGGSSAAFDGVNKSITLYDAIVDSFSRLDAGYYDMLCEGPASNIFNETYCDAMSAGIPEVEHVAAVCRDTYNGIYCLEAYSISSKLEETSSNDLVNLGIRNPYHCMLLYHPFCDPTTFPSLCTD